jgi:hypothetical protein
MSAPPDRVLVVESDHRLDDLVTALQGAGLSMEESHGSRASAGFQRMDRTFNATFPVTELIAVAGSPAAIHGAASVIREYLRAGRRRVRICKADGSSVEVDGDVDIQELQKLIDAAASSPNSE